MKYILNESPYKTTNNFKINNIKVDIDIPTIDNIKPFANKNIKQEIIDKELNNKIGLPINKYLNVDIDFDFNKEILEYNFDKDNNSLITNINVTTKEHTVNELYIILKSIDDTKHFSFININTTLVDSTLDVTVINLLNDNSNSFVSYDNIVDKYSLLINNHLDIGGNIKINNYYSELIGKYSDNMINTLYLGKNKNILDYNYHIKSISPYSTSNIRTEGMLNDEAYKQHKGIIDFVEGSSKSKGEELENCILLSDKAISKSAPLLMCHEEDVEGSHGVSTGKIDKDKLFYLMSRGLSEKEANKLIIYANFNKVIGSILDIDIRNMIIEYLDNII